MSPVSTELYPFAGHYLELDGLRLHYLDEGSGPPVVMVHGNPTWSFYYRNLVLALGGRYRAVAPDHMGCGRSDKPGDDRYEYRMRRRVADLGALMDHLGLDDISLVVHDWGGPIGLGWAVEHPERVGRLVILNTTGFTRPPGKGMPWPLGLARTVLGTVLVQGLNAFARGATRMAMHRRSMSRELRDAYCAPYDSWPNRIATLRFVQDAPFDERDPSFQDLKRVEERLHLLCDLPALVCWGERDFVFDHHFLARWQELLPHAELHRFPDAGHYVLEDAAEEVIPLITDFLDRHGARPGGER